MQRSQRRSRCAWPAAVAVPGLLALTAAGCGGSSGSADGGVPTAGGGSDSSAQQATTGATSREDAMLRFTRCLRQHGVKVSDPHGGVGGPVRVQAPRAGGGGLDKASAVCQKYAPSGGQIDPKQRERFLDQARQFARCMRQHGQEVPDPSASGGGIRMRFSKQGGPTPAFKEAEKTCQHYLPKPPAAGQ